MNAPFFSTSCCFFCSDRVCTLVNMSSPFEPPQEGKTEHDLFGGGVSPEQATAHTQSFFTDDALLSKLYHTPLLMNFSLAFVCATCGKNRMVCENETVKCFEPCKALFCTNRCYWEHCEEHVETCPSDDPRRLPLFVMDPRKVILHDPKALKDYQDARTNAETPTEET